ncbi:MAG: alpha/beta fold hydrolase, partial [Myxococcota bacterium]
MLRVGWIMLVVSCAARTPEFAVQSMEEGPFTFGPCPETLLHAAQTECALVQAPLDGSVPSSRTITLFVRRIPAVPGSVSADQVWALDGGPGFAGDVFTDPDFYQGVRAAGYDVIIPTHRGSVYGTGLSCPGQQAPDSPGGGRVVAAEYPACVEALQAQWGDDLARFSAVDAARDVLYLMRRMKTEGRVVVFGGSYGSVWGQRLLQLDPPIAGMWLDSIVDLDEGLDQADENAHDAGMTLLGRCADTPACAERFPDGPLATAEALIETMPEPICGLPPATIRRLLNRLLSSHPADQALVAPTVLRLHRCDEDGPALMHAVARMDQSANTNPPLAYNPLLNRLISRWMIR